MPGLGDIATRRLDDKDWLRRQLKRLHERIGRVETATPAGTVVPFTQHDSAANFALSTSATILKTVTVVVPAGYTSVALMASGTVSARNNTGSQDYMNMSVSIASDPTTATRWAAMIDSLATPGQGVVVTGSTSAAALLNAAPNTSIPVSVYGWSGVAPWPADPFNTADIDVFALLIR